MNKKMAYCFCGPWKVFFLFSYFFPFGVFFFFNIIIVNNDGSDEQIFNIFYTNLHLISFQLNLMNSKSAKCKVN